MSHYKRVKTVEKHQVGGDTNLTWSILNWSGTCGLKYFFKELVDGDMVYHQKNLIAYK
jgi:hypothetical protein